MEEIIFPEAINNFKKVLDKTSTSWDYLSSAHGGKPVEKFEKAFAKAENGKYCIALSNCTSGLTAALLASNVLPGDEVILPSYSWPQTLTPVLLLGATPVFADVSENSLNISPESVKKLISEKTKAIIGVHLHGVPADTVSLERIAKDAEIKLIFDSAQCFGALVKGKAVGYYGDFTVYSFGRGKTFSVGEGGALICKNRKIFESLMAITQHPVRAHKEIDDFELRNSIDGVSLNFRIHPLIALLAHEQLKELIKSERIKKLRNKYQEFVRLVQGTGIEYLLPSVPDGTLPCTTKFPVFPVNEKDLNLLSEVLKGTDFSIINSDLLPLQCTKTIREGYFLPFLANGGERNKIKKHWSHKLKNSPNAEKLSLKQQVFIKTEC